MWINGARLHRENITKHFGQPYLFLKKSEIYWDKHWIRTHWLYDASSMGSEIFHTALNALPLGSTSVYVIAWMVLILLNV